MISKFTNLLDKLFQRSENQTICLFGDSITWGSCDNEKGGWGKRLRDYFNETDKKIEVRNFGVGGDTTNELLQRFETECKKSRPSVIIIAIGINDSKYIGKNTDQSVIPLDKFKNNLEELTKQAKKFTKKIIFLGLTIVEEEKTMPIFWEGEDTNIFYSNERINLYNSTIKKVAQENGLFLIDMLDLLNDDDIEDGLHPNSRGHEKMFLRVKEFLLLNK